MQGMEQIQISVNKNSYEDILSGATPAASHEEVATATTEMEHVIRKWLTDNNLEAQVSAVSSTGKILVSCSPDVGNALEVAHQKNEFPGITQFLRNVQRIQYRTFEAEKSWGDKVGEKRDFGIS